MLHAKFQDHTCRTSGSREEDILKVFTIYGHGSHLGHVTWTIYINFLSPLPRMLHINLIGQAFQRRRRLKMVEDDDNNNNDNGPRSMGIL